jgi:hypothetical protein
VGCIKTSLKKKWDYIFATEFKFRNDRQRDFGYDWEYEMKKIAEQPAYATLPCHCPFSCVNPPIETDEFDHDDEYTPDMKRSAEFYRDVFERLPTLFGPYADDLSKYTWKWAIDIHWGRLLEATRRRKERMERKGTKEKCLS